MELENFCFNNFGSATPFLNGFQIVNSYSLKQAFQARDQNEKEKYWGLWDFFWGEGVGGLDLLATYSTYTCEVRIRGTCYVANCSFLAREENQRILNNNTPSKKSMHNTYIALLLLSCVFTEQCLYLFQKVFFKQF